MKKLILTLILFGLLATPALATMSLGGWQEGAPRSTHALFDFTSDKVRPGVGSGAWITIPNNVINPEPKGVLGNVTASQYYGDTSMGYFYDPTKITINFELPNYENGAYKDLWIQVLATSAPTNISVTAHDGTVFDYTYSIVQQYSPSQDFYNVEIQIVPNPLIEKVQFDIGTGTYGFAELVSAHIDTICQVPVPGAILLGGIGVALVGWLRGRRTL